MLAIASDNGAKIIKGVRLLGEKIDKVHGLGTVSPSSIIRHLSHAIQLGVKDALNTLDEELKKVGHW